MAILAERNILTEQVNRQTLFRQLYLDVFPKVALFVSKKGGGFQDAEDIFQDALIVLYENMNRDGAVITSSREAYLMGISRHLWFRKFDSKVRHKEVELADVDFSVIDEPKPNELRVLQLLEQTTRKCLNLLHAFYYEQLPLQQISKLLGFSSERSATVQKYKCLEKVRDSVKQNAIDYAHFIN